MKLLIALLPLLLTATVSGFVREGGAEVIFPQGVRFTVGLTIPATEITDATLTITPQGHDPITLSIDVQQAALVYDEPEARLIYVWNIPVDDPTPLFSQITYRWSFEAQDGKSGTLEDGFTFADPRVVWSHSLDPAHEFSVTFSSSLFPLGDTLRQVYDLLAENTGRRLRRNLLIAPMPAGCIASEDGTRVAVGVTSGTAIACDPDIETAVFSDYQVIEVPANASAEDVVVDKLVRDYYAALWHDKAVPEWFIAGLVKFYITAPKNLLLPPLQQAVRDGTLFPLNQMNTANPALLWQAQSFGMVLYIAHQIGVPGLFNLARVDAENFDADYAQLVGQPLAALLPALQQWIFTRSAESDFGITPYQPPTALPSATFTPSDTPTFTPPPTLTFTPSPTFTNTPRGVRTYIAPPTVTPSQTLTPLPPTVTPRPPGSLPTVTPAPTALQVAVERPGVQAGVITFLILLLVLLLFFFIRLGNRR